MNNKRQISCQIIVSILDRTRLTVKFLPHSSTGKMATHLSLANGCILQFSLAPLSDFAAAIFILYPAVENHLQSKDILQCRIPNNGRKSTLYNAKLNASYEESSRDTIQMIP